jgi:hypothetical protein
MLGCYPAPVKVSFIKPVARIIVNAKESAVLSDAAAAEIKTEREPPRPRSDVQLVLPMNENGYPHSRQPSSRFFNRSK